MVIGIKTELSSASAERNLQETYREMFIHPRMRQLMSVAMGYDKGGDDVVGDEIDLPVDDQYEKADARQFEGTTQEIRELAAFSFIRPMKPD